VTVRWLKFCNLRQIQCMVGYRYVSSTEIFLINEMAAMIKDLKNTLRLYRRVSQNAIPF